MTIFGSELPSNLPPPAIDPALIRDFVLRRRAFLAQSREESRLEKAKRPLREEHDEFVKKCPAVLREQNAEEIRASLRAANARLDEGVKQLEASRTPEEMRFDDAEGPKKPESMKSLGRLAEKAWTQFRERDAASAEIWLQWFRANHFGGYAEGSDGRIGMLLLAHAARSVDGPGR